MAELDANGLTQAFMRLLEERGPGFRGIPHEGAAYTSRDPGAPRYREGEVSSDVGFLDPVDFIAGALGPGARNAVKALARQLSRPRPGAARSFSPEAEGLMGQIDTILDDVRRGMREPLPRDFAHEAAEKIGRQRAQHEAEEALYLARRQEEIDAAFEERFRQYRSREAPPPPAAAPEPQGRRVMDLASGEEVPRPGATPPPPGRAKEYADVIRKLFEQGGR